MNLRPSFVRMLRLAPWVLILVSSVFAVGACLQALHYPFVSDDNVYVVENTKLAALHLNEIWRLFAEPYNDFAEFLPLRDLSYWFDIALFGMAPSAFRVHSIILYLLCLPLVYATTHGLWRYFRPEEAAGAAWASAVVTALFALHPAHVEAVVWISGRKDVLSGLFSLFALWLAVNARQERGLSTRYATGTLLALLAAMLSKVTAVAVAPVIAMLWVMFWRDVPTPQRRRTQLLWPIATLLLAACAALIVTANSMIREPGYFGIEAVARAFAVLGWLARLAVTPEGRHYFYPVLDDSQFSVMVAVGAAVFAASAFGGLLLLRKRSLEGFVLLAFCLLCMPYIQLIPYKTSSLVSDRFITIAVWPAMLLLVSLSWRLGPVSRKVLLLSFTLLWAVQSVERPRDWRTFEALVDTDLRAFPGFFMPAMYKTDVLLSQGSVHEAGETAGAITIPEVRNTMVKLVKAHQAVARSITTGDSHDAMEALTDFGRDLMQLPVQARWNTPLRGVWRINRKYLEYEWRNLAGYFPDDMLLRYNAGSSLLSVQKYEGAIVHLRAAAESQRLPESLRGSDFKDLGLALLASGHAAEAEAPLLASLQQSRPDMSSYCALSDLYQQTGRFAEAARAGTECRSHVSSKTIAP